MPTRIPTQVYYNRRASLPPSPRKPWTEEPVESQVFYNRGWTPTVANTGNSQMCDKSHAADPYWAVSPANLNRLQRGAASNTNRSCDQHHPSSNQNCPPSVVYLRRGSSSHPNSRCGDHMTQQHGNWPPQGSGGVAPSGHGRRGSSSYPNSRMADVTNQNSAGNIVYLRRSSASSPNTRITDPQNANNRPWSPPHRQTNRSSSASGAAWAWSTSPSQGTRRAQRERDFRGR